jgi:hypothetical protein
VLPDDGSDGVIPFPMPTQILFGLFSEVFEIRRRRKKRSNAVGGPCPFDLHRCALRRNDRLSCPRVVCQLNLRPDEFCEESR